MLNTKKDELTPDELATLAKVAAEDLFTGLNGQHMKKLRELKLIQNSLSGVPVVSDKGRQLLAKQKHGKRKLRT